MKNFDWLLKTPIAHRGLHDANHSENSLPAYNRAIEKGYNIEIDVRLSKDKELIVFHDDTLLRLCGVDKKVSELNLVELQALTLPCGEKIPTLNEVLNLVSSRTGLLIELKSNGDGVLERMVYETLNTYTGKYAVQSFHPYSMRWFRTHAERVPRGLLATYGKMPTKWYQAFVLRHLILMRYCKPDFLSYDENFIDRHCIQQKKLPKLAWTVRSKSRQEELLCLNLSDNVIFENFEP